MLESRLKTVRIMPLTGTVGLAGAAEEEEKEELMMRVGIL
jgi:hypothetical protein